MYNVDTSGKWYTVRLRDGSLWDGPFTFEDAQTLARQRETEYGEAFIVKRSVSPIRRLPVSAE